MRLPVLTGTIRRRLLVNFRVEAEVVERLLPHPFRPKLHRSAAIAGICLIRLEHVRPAGFPSSVGLSSENAAHRVAVVWENAAGVMQEGVFIPRRDTGSLLNKLAGGRIFPGEHHHADFVVADDGRAVDLAMQSRDRNVSVHVIGHETEALPPASIFGALHESSSFFKGGSLGYSVKRRPGQLDGLSLHTPSWKVAPFAVERAASSYFEDEKLFPAGSVEFDHALVMRDIEHEWHQAEDLYTEPRQLIEAETRATADCG